MIRELIIECEEITMIETNNTLRNNIKVTMSFPTDTFLQDLETKEIMQGLDAYEVMQAIVDIYGIDFIRDWHDELGKS